MLLGHVMCAFDLSMTNKESVMGVALCVIHGDIYIYSVYIQIFYLIYSFIHFWIDRVYNNNTCVDLLKHPVTTMDYCVHSLLM